MKKISTALFIKQTVVRATAKGRRHPNTEDDQELKNIQLAITVENLEKRYPFQDLRIRDLERVIALLCNKCNDNTATSNWIKKQSRELVLEVVASSKVIHSRLREVAQKENQNTNYIQQLSDNEEKVKSCLMLITDDLEKIKTSLKTQIP